MAEFQRTETSRRTRKNDYFPEDGELLALVGTESDFEEALEFDCPILGAPEIVEAWRIPEFHPDSVEWDHARQDEEQRWSTLSGGEH